jgi:CBS domain containing-hemolysin-like protein
MIDQILLLVVLLFFSGLFSGAETALFSISRTKALHLAKGTQKTNQLIKKLKDDPPRLLNTMLVGNTIANIAAAAIATKIALDIFPNHAIGLATGAMTLLVLIFGQVFPKSLATRNNILIARLTIYPIYLFSLLFYPIVLLLNVIPAISGRIQRTPSVTEEELMTFVEVVREGGEINEEEQQLIHNIFEFDDTNASEIMTPRADMFVIEADDPLNLKAITDSGFTRIPVIEGTIDNVVGILNVKDLLTFLSENQRLPNARQLMRPPYFVPEHKKLDSLMSQFKKRKTHMAIVVDEHGGVSGLITLEDAIEELVGEIRDETDKEERLIVKKKANEWIVLGKTEIEEVNDVIGMNIPDTDEFDTFSGYILEHIGRIPSVNEQFTIGDFEVVVRSMEGNRIKEYVVRQLSENSGNPPSQPAS